MSQTEQIAKIVQANGAKLYDTEVVSEFDETIFRVYVTKEGGINLDDCANISNDLSPFLDVHPPVGGAYRLEVSSPGLERKLSKPEHFANAIGERVKLKVPGQDRLKGILKSANDDSIVIETKHGDEEYPYSQIAKAKTYVAW
jgi:ribosome maturation factor RimP